jgi:mediator of RNA polymerase II transcription subunit 5
MVDGETNGDAGLEVAALQLDAVMDLPTMNTRAGLYVFFNSLVSICHSNSSGLTLYS